MARLLALKLEPHPRMGACFVIRFSWNSRLEDPIASIKAIPSVEREYEETQRRWWIAAKHAPVLAMLFENWAEEVTALALACPDALSAVMEEVLRERVLAVTREVMDAVPALSGDTLMSALGEAVGEWLDQWRHAAPEAAAVLSPERMHAVRRRASNARVELSTWALRAAFTRELLAPSRKEDQTT